MKQGKLFYDAERGRYNFYYEDDGTECNYGGIHCGECMDVMLSGIWIPTRIELSSEWYLVGLPGLRLEGLEIRM